MERRKDNRNRVLNEGEYQRPDGRYQYTYRDCNNKRCHVYSWKLDVHDKVPPGKKNEPSLREKIRKIEKDLNSGKQLGNNLKVKDLVVEYTSTRINVKTTTRQGYKTQINFLNKHEFGNRRVVDVTRADAKKFLTSLQQGENKKSYSSITSLRGVLRPAFEYAIDAEIITRNPFDFDLRNYLVNDSVKRFALTPKQERDFLNFVKNDPHFSQYYYEFVLLFNSGLRISEFCGLSVKDIDMKNRRIYIRRELIYTGGKAYIDSPKTEHGYRVIAFEDKAEEALKYILKKRKKKICKHSISGFSDFLNIDDRGKYTVAYYWEKKFKYAVDKYNSIYKVQMPHITPHICRHTYNTNLIKRGLGDDSIAALMGHSNAEISHKVYGHIDIEHVEYELKKTAETANEIRAM